MMHEGRLVKFLCALLGVVAAIDARPRCGGTLTEPRGVIHSPNFPHKFAVPIHCEWIIDASHAKASMAANASIYVYLTQLYVFEGLSFKEYQIYDQTFQLNGRDVHSVSETNVTRVRHLHAAQDYLVITLKLDSIESTHLRVLDHFLDVYGFNITYEISSAPPRADRCSMMDCGFTGICRDHFTHFKCDCFEGYEGKTCSQGPNSLCTSKSCTTGGTCLHVGDSSVRCLCPPGYEGERCEKNIKQSKMTQGCDQCFMTCAADGKIENACKCPEGSNSTTKHGIITGYKIQMQINPPPNIKPHQLRTFLENYLSRLLKDSAGIESVEIIDFQSFQPHHVNLTLRLSANRVDEALLKSITAKWSERGYIGNLTVSPSKQIIALTPMTIFSLQGISVLSSGQTLAGEDIILSCTHNFSESDDPVSASSFRWFKDGIFINVTASTRKWMRFSEDNIRRDQYTSQLGIKNASPLDQGTFRCQVVENDIQHCYSKELDIQAPPRVWIEPMSLTVKKGEKFTIKCFTALSNHKNAKYTYSWTKNKELLPIKTTTEHYEILYPMGSILQVSTISKSTSFSCLIQDGAAWSEQSIFVNVIDSELIKTCPGEKHLKLLWPETAPGTESLQECPSGYTGVARRACILREARRPTWYQPDFSGCLSSQLDILNTQFQNLQLGYETAKPLSILKGYRRYLNAKRLLLPGEGFTILQLVNNVVNYANNSISESVYGTVYDIVDGVLQRKLSLINETQLILLQEIVKQQSLVFESPLHQTFPTLDITLAKSDKTGFHVPQTRERYPEWFSYKLHLALPRHYFAGSSASSPPSGAPYKSATLATVVYRNLSAFLPLRSAIRLKDGVEMDYEVVSNIVSSWLTVQGREMRSNASDILYTMEFQHDVKTATQDEWKLQCAVADFASYGYAWDTQSCITRLLDNGRTRCICPRSGTYAVLLTMKPSFAESEQVPSRQLVILFGCSTCSLLATIAALILTVYWFSHSSCLVFLKIQCCLSVVGSMLVFVYAFLDEVPTELFLLVMSLLEGFLLNGLSSQLSNLLIIYAELVQLSRVKGIKQTIVLIITGASLIAVFGNYMAHLTMNTRIDSWWLLHGSLAFNIFVTCCIIIILLYFVLLSIVLRKLVGISSKYEKQSETMQNRLKLLKRSVFVFCSITATVLSSILYINCTENELYYYIFSALSAVMGAVIFCCYILCAEIPVKQLLITRLKEASDEKPNADADRHLKFFTNQKPEVENESMPYFCRTSESQFGGGGELMCKQKYAEIGASSFKTAASANFNAGDAPHSSGGVYQPQRECLNSPDLLDTKKFVELDLVASSITTATSAAAAETETSFYTPATAAMTTPAITITQPPDERERPEGEETVGAGGGGDKIPKLRTDNLDAVMDSITHDLDYLLHDKEFNEDAGTVPPPSTVSGGTVVCQRRISKPPSLTVFEQIAEESEEEIKVPEAITNVSRTSC